MLSLSSLFDLILAQKTQSIGPFLEAREELVATSAAFCETCTISEQQG